MAQFDIRFYIKVYNTGHYRSDDEDDLWTTRELSSQINRISETSDVWYPVTALKFSKCYRNWQKHMKTKPMNVWFTVFSEFCDGLADFPGLIDPEDECTKFLRNVGKCLPSDSASHLRRLVFLVFMSQVQCVILSRVVGKCFKNHWSTG